MWTVQFAILQIKKFSGLEREEKYAKGTSEVAEREFTHGLLISRTGSPSL